MRIRPFVPRRRTVPLRPHPTAGSTPPSRPVLEGVGWLVRRKRWGLVPQQLLLTSQVDVHNHTNCQHQCAGTCPSSAKTCRFYRSEPRPLESLTWSEYRPQRMFLWPSFASALPHASNSTSGTLPAIYSHACNGTRPRTGTSWSGRRSMAVPQPPTLVHLPRDLPRPQLLYPCL